jgi:hypothetical protein
MNKILFAMAILMGLAASASALTIYDIQYTNSPGVDNSYPSVYVGREVILDGIVTGTDYAQGGYFISEPISGAWRGIYVAANATAPLRETKSGSAVWCMKASNDLSPGYQLLQMLVPRLRPPPTLDRDPGQLSRADEAEAYEGVYVRVMSASVASSKSKAGRFTVTDGSGQCTVSTGSFSRQKSLSPPPELSFASIVGIVVFGFSEFSLNPAPLATPRFNNLSPRKPQLGKDKINL